MTEATPATEHSFAVQKQVTDPAQRPLEVYHLSHDLRGPLNSILGFCELLLEEIEGPLNEIQHTDISAIYQSAQNLLHLVNTMVDLSKLEGNRLNFNFGAVALDKVIQRIMEAGFGTIKPEQVEVVVSLPLTIPPVWADQDRVEQMIKNLLRFAFKLKKKGAIILGATQNDNPEVTLQVDIDEVKLAQAELEELFELVVHIDSAGRSELGLGGLDLPLVRYLAEKQQGRVWAENGRESGLTLYLSLPQHEPAASSE
jgi:signal transduction histidine kinase